MDIKEYIASGILENYVLGTVSDQERQEVECMSHIYPELREELVLLQESIEQIALSNAVPPPAELKAKVMAAISKEPQVKEEGGKVIDLNQADNDSKPLNTWLSAAAVVLLVAVCSFFYLQNNQYIKLEQDLISTTNQAEELKEESTKLATEVEAIKAEKEAQLNLANILANENTARIALNGTEASPESRVIVFWNKESNEVLMQLENLPEPTQDQQYQLWAIVDGTPTDMGVFDYTTALNKIQQMPYKVEGAQAFAITLEPAGGSKEPTLSNMYVVGATS